jgi:hypothetical protein
MRCRLVHVPLAGVFALQLGEQAVLGPAQFGTHCVPNWKSLKKSLHVAQVVLFKALTKIRRQLFGRQRQQRLAIRHTRRTALLKLHDVPSHLPASVHLNDIHRPQHTTAWWLYGKWHNFHLEIEKYSVHGD